MKDKNLRAKDTIVFDLCESKNGTKRELKYQGTGLRWCQGIQLDTLRSAVVRVCTKHTRHPGLIPCVCILFFYYYDLLKIYKTLKNAQI